MVLVDVNAETVVACPHCLARPQRQASATTQGGGEQRQLRHVTSCRFRNASTVGELRQQVAAAQEQDLNRGFRPSQLIPNGWVCVHDGDLVEDRNLHLRNHAIQAQANQRARRADRRTRVIGG